MVLSFFKSPTLLKTAFGSPLVSVLAIYTQCLSLPLINYMSTLSQTPPSLTRIFAAPGLTLKVLCLKRFLIPRSPMSKRNLS